ncbi:MAG: hypothetical protein RL754_576 [Bacteroidota bacterium]
MNHKNSKYPLALKLAVCLGEEKEHYSPEFLKTIPKGTMSAWRKQEASYYYGMMQDSPEQAELVKLFKQQNSFKNREKAVLDSYMHFINFLKECMGEKGFIRFLNGHKNEFVKHVEALPSNITRKRFLKTVGISPSRYSGWELEVNIACFSSVDKVCVKRRPRQITKDEHQAIRRLVQKRQGPNKFAIWADGIKAGKIKCGKATFYKHTKDLMTSHQERKKPRDPQLVRANFLHEIWHADVSQIRTMDGNKYYFYCVIDNKSRAVLAWSLEHNISQAHSANVLRQAFINSKPPKRRKKKLKYMTDGGSENNRMESLVKYTFTQLVAWKDIRSSNSMIERVFHTMKNEYKYILQAANYQELKELLHDTIEKYMDRPHSRLGIYTPREVIMKNDNWFDLPDTLKKAAEDRLRVNQNSPCKNCACSNKEDCSKK